MTASKDIAHLRSSYERAELDESQSASAPQQQFEQWLQEAIAEVACGVVVGIRA
jgi:pyridoxamine 5'-phosphate oxidase